MSSTVLARLAALPTKDIAELRRMWRDLIGDEPPPGNRTHIVRRLAYRIQELAHGGLSPRTRARLDALADDEDDRVKGKPRRKRPDDIPVTGTRLVREWKGVEHCVTVIADGFDYDGRRFQSLSAVARAITGTRWNGPQFFGLRNPGKSR
ncbi:MAG: DUF2924 domain-containing protein [Rhodospirillaceae bacterium]